MKKNHHPTNTKKLILHKTLQILNKYRLANDLVSQGIHSQDYSINANKIGTSIFGASQVWKVVLLIIHQQSLMAIPN